MLRATGLVKHFGGRTLFAGMDLVVHPGDRIGLIGPNGAGKTTLLRILAGFEPVDDGRVDRDRGVALGYLRQEIDPASGRTVIDEARTALEKLLSLEAEIERLEEDIAEHGRERRTLPAELSSRYDRLRHEFERAEGYRAESMLRETLVGLGLGPDRWDEPLSTLSGGWLMRVELAKLLLARPDVLLLDEPTNHLDLPSIAWFEGVLRDYPGAAVVVSHDRFFLGRHATAIAELEGGTAVRYRGNYERYLEQKELRRAEAEGRLRTLDRKIQHAQTFVDRFGAKQSKATQAESRKKQIVKLRQERDQTARAAGVQQGRAMRLRFPPAPRSGDIVLRFEDVAKGYDDLCIYQGLDLELRRGDRVALVGPNGAGKTTLLRLAAGSLEPDAGSRELGVHVRPGFYAQHQVDALDPGRTVLGEIESIARTEDVPRLRGLLGAFLFSGDDVEKRVSVLSGGEKARLALAKLLLARPNLLILDEPTNHLDIRAREVLAEALAGFEGTLLFISHDRVFINGLANRVLEVTRGSGLAQLRAFPGNYDDYTERLEREARAASETRARAGSEKGPRRAPSAKRAPRRQFTLNRLRAESDQVEAAIAETEAEIERIAWLTADPMVARNGDRMRELADERRALEGRQSELYASWEGLAAEIEAIEEPEA